MGLREPRVAAVEGRQGPPADEAGAVGRWCVGRPGGLGRRKRLRPSRKLRLLPFGVRSWRSLAVAAGATRFGRRYQIRRPKKATSSSLSQYYLAGTPSADLHRGKGEAEGDVGEKQLAPQALGPARCLWRRRGLSRLAGLCGGQRAEPGAAGLWGALWSLPRTSLCGSP